MNDLMDNMKTTPYSILMMTLTVVAMSGCGDNANSKTAPSRWIRISLPNGVDRSSGGLTERDLNEIKLTIPTIERAVPERDALTAISDGITSREVRLCATLSDMHHLLTDARAQIADGRFLDSQDGQHVPHVIVISQPLAADLFPGETAIDKSVFINETEFRVVGVLGTPADTTMEVGLADAYMELNPHLEPNAPKPVQQRDHKYPTYPLDRIWLKVSRLSEIESTKKIIEEILEHNHPGTEYSLDSDFKVQRNVADSR